MLEFRWIMFVADRAKYDYMHKLVKKKDLWVSQMILDNWNPTLIRGVYLGLLQQKIRKKSDK